MIAFSTSWNAHRHEKGGPMLREIEALGFQWVELGHGIRAELMPGILKYLNKSELRVCSVHNYCPLPAGMQKDAPDFLTYTALSQADRKRAVQKTKETIDFAEQVGAAAVVLHLGSLFSEKEERPLVEALSQGKKSHAVDSKLKLVTARQKKVAPLWDRVHECLRTITSYAESKKIKLGIENRAYFGELPSEFELENLWRRYGSETVVYWHDFGHAQIKQERGWANHWELFSANKMRLGGCHIHDASFPSQDHGCLGRGNVEWSLYLSQLPKNIPWVLEFHSRVSEENIHKSVSFLKNFENSSS